MGPSHTGHAAVWFARYFQLIRGASVSRSEWPRSKVLTDNRRLLQASKVSISVKEKAAHFEATGCSVCTPGRVAEQDVRCFRGQTRVALLATQPGAKSACAFSQDMV